MIKKINIKNCLFILAILFGSFIGAENVFAATMNYDFSGYWYERFDQDGNNHSSWKLEDYYVDGEVSYCIEPGIPEGNPMYQGTWENTGLSDAIKERILLTAYYGYTYPGHQTREYRAATQGMIWATILGNNTTVRFSTARWNAGTPFDVSQEQAEIERLIANHYVRPSFNAQSFNVQVGQSVTLTDTNNVLSNYSVSVDGANYSIDGNNLTITPTKSGKITLSMTKNMPYQSAYKIFYGEGIQNMLVPGTTDPVIARINVNSYYANVEMNKEDSETGVKAQGQATLEGAIYGVFSLDGTLITKITTNASGYAKSDSVLSYGSYYLQEITPSKGYYLDNTKYYFDTKGVASVKRDVTENVIKNDISILKQYEFVDGNTTFLNAESGITFEIFYPNGTKYGEVTTDKNGYARFTIPYGIWKLHQKNTTTGYEKIYDFYITVDENSEKLQYYNILNNALSAYLQVYKTDSETGKTIAIADTTFKILNTDTNQIVSQFVGGKVYDEFKTDETGKFVTYLKLEAGNYKLIEVANPNGYVLDKEGLTFTIGDGTHYSYTTYGAFVTYYFKNTPIKGQLEVNKTGEVVVIENDSFTYEKLPLDGVKFNIYASEDILSADKNYLYYHAGDLVDAIISNDEGYAISKKLPLGKYYIVEVETKDGYVLDSEKHYFTLTEKDNMTSIVYESLSKLNYLKKGTLEFTKTDLTSGEPVPNTKLEVFTENGEKIFSGITDQNGKIIIENLFVGKFYIVETEPATGYKLSDEITYFEITDDGEVVKANMVNEKITGNLVFAKVDEDGNPLAGVSINVFKSDGTLIGTYITNSEGLVIIENLEYGDYSIKEVATVDGYELSDETILFSITEDGADVNVSMVNKKLPQTDMNDYLNYVAISLIGIGSVLFIVASSRKKKRK